MQRKQVRVSLSRLAVISLGVLVVLASAALAEDPRSEAHHQGPCSNATLNGSYGYYRTGPVLGDGGQVVAVGIWTFDGRGNTVGTESTNNNGDVSFDQEFSGGYHVNQNCSGKLLNEDGEEFARLIVVNGGQGYYLFLEGNPVYLVATRIRAD